MSVIMGYDENKKVLPIKVVDDGNGLGKIVVASS